MHGIGEYRYVDGNIYNGSWANNKRNGIGILTFPYGSLFQCNFKDDKMDGLQIIHYKATGDTVDAEYQDDL